MARVLAGMVLPLYVPALMLTFALGVLIPVLPLYLRDAGLTYTGVTTVIGAVGVGALVAQVPFGRLVVRWGQGRVLVLSSVIIGVSSALLGVTTVVVALISLQLASGVGSTGWFLAQQSYLATDVEAAVRGRAASGLGGTVRLGFLLGPLAGGLIAARFGFDAAFVVAGVAATLSGAPEVLGRGGRSAADRTVGRRAPTTPLTSLFRAHRRNLVAAGLMQFCVVGARQGRMVVIPLMGDALGLDVGSVGVLVAIGALSDLSLFPIAGYLMDRFGRQAAIVPFLVLFGGGLLIAAVADSTAALTVAAATTGFANGLGAGTMMTVGSDLAPADSAARFLSMLGSTRDLGRILGPLVVGWMADAVGLPASAVVLAGMAFAGAGIMVFVLGDTRHTQAAT